jgi:hypothetical protein
LEIPATEWRRFLILTVCMLLFHPKECIIIIIYCSHHQGIN